MRCAAPLLFPALLIAAPLSLATDVVVEVHDTNGSVVSDAVVWAVPADRPVIPAPKATAVIDQQNRTFIPHVLPVRLGTSVSFPNSDNVRHQVYSFSPAKTFQLPLYIGTPANPVVFDKPGVVALGCNIHDQMSAFVVVVETPYFAKSGEDGRALLRDLHDGRFRIHVWHPNMDGQLVPVPLQIAGEENRELTISFRKK